MNIKNIYYYIVKKIQQFSAFLFYLFIIVFFFYSLGFSTNAVDLKMNLKDFYTEVQSSNRLLFHWSIIMLIVFVFLLMIQLHRRGKHSFISFVVTLTAGILGLITSMNSLTITNKIKVDYNNLDFTKVAKYLHYTPSYFVYKIGAFINYGLLAFSVLIILSAILITFTVYEEV